MNELTLNIYGENDEIVKIFKTNHLRWKIFTEALKLQDTIQGKDMDAQLTAINGFMLSVFVGMTTEDLENADGFDVFNVFKMIVSRANGLKGTGNEKKRVNGAPADDVSIEYLLYEMTFTVANATGADVFKVFNQETDDVIGIYNYLIERGQRNSEPAAPKTETKKENNKKSRDILWDYI